MKILFLIFIIFQITHINADEIYNLLKIPNLEIYKFKTDNNIRFLNSKKNFKIGVNNNISCNKSYPQNLDNKFPIIQKNINFYNSDFLNKINLRYVVLCEDLFISEINTGGIPDTEKRTLILDINFNPKYFERMVHHEIFHMIQKSYVEIFDEKHFSSFNDVNFNYAECSTCSDRLNLDLYDVTNGFLTEYSKSIVSEDMAEIFSLMMTDKIKLKKLIKKDKILEKKVIFIKSAISKIDNNVL